MLLALLTLLAEDAPAAPAQPGGGSLTSLLVPGLLMVIAFYWLLIRPAQRQERERQNLLSNLKKNDKVLTAGGLIGIVAGIKDKEDEVTIKVDENSNLRLRVTKSSIVRILQPADEPGRDVKEPAPQETRIQK